MAAAKVDRYISDQHSRRTLGLNELIEQSIACPKGPRTVPNQPIAPRRDVRWPAPDAFTAGPFKAQLGVRRIPMAEWLDVDRNYDEQVAEKLRLYSTIPQHVVIRMADEPTAAEIELVTVIADELARLVPDQQDRVEMMIAKHGVGVHTAGLLTQEDWVIMDGRDEQLPVIAASVSFPTRWDLVSKLGLGVTAVHDPVHEYDNPLAQKAIRFMHRVMPETCWSRNNWNIVDEPALYQPQATFRGPGANPAVTAENAGETLFLRVERETFRRLAGSWALVFGIRVHTTPLVSLANDPDRLRTLRAAIRAMPDAPGRYKGIPAFVDAFEAWAEQTLGKASSP